VKQDHILKADCLTPSCYKFEIPGQEGVKLISNIFHEDEAMLLIIQILKDIPPEFLPVRAYLNGSFCGFRGI